jgi:hypothetical protein
VNSPYRVTKKVFGVLERLYREGGASVLANNPEEESELTAGGFSATVTTAPPERPAPSVNYLTRIAGLEERIEALETAVAALREK